MQLSFFRNDSWDFPIDRSASEELVLGRAAADEFIENLRFGLPPDALASIGEASQGGTYAEWSFWTRLQEHLEKCCAVQSTAIDE